jgi:hypothetical protein
VQKGTAEVPQIHARQGRFAQAQELEPASTLGPFRRAHGSAKLTRLTQRTQRMNGRGCLAALRQTGGRAKLPARRNLGYARARR